ncbi:hypothetical protein [Streptomyces sp. NRRL B-1347]|uniref:hypothetical protein n=1 Tax=Streptomyces sp. NRRL B-1347 TaxID=1476877 RepID=UPI00068EAB20|nr:hypothetical protein [Streptomyces sp. NRRL B-1347]
MTQATYVATEDVPADKLIPFPGNAKRGDVSAILDSLRRNAQYRAVVARRLPGGELVTLTGNHTVAAFREHGPGDCGVHTKRTVLKYGKRTVPCGVCGNKAGWKPTVRTEIITCDDDTARRINLADNRTADLGSYDDRALHELLAALDGDLTGTAYTDSDVDDLLKTSGALAESASAFLEDFAAPAPGAPSTHPFSDTAPPTGAAQTPQPPEGTQERPADSEAAAAPPPHSEGVHTGPAPYTGPGARQPAGDGIPLPTSPQMAPLQWVFTLEQRDTVRAAIKAEQIQGGHDTAAQALTAICSHYLAAAPEQASSDAEGAAARV